MIIGLANELCCARCGHENLHQVGVFVYRRDQEDSETGVRVHVDKHHTVTIDNQMDGNPSGRRDGIRIYFACESCNGGTVMDIYQHKGVEYVDIQPAPANVPDIEGFHEPFEDEDEEARGK